jgi:dTDP-D-glucose 4,6-dehydratase
MNNTYGTHVLLEAARKAGTIRRFINVSTDEVSVSGLGPCERGRRRVCQHRLSTRQASIGAAQPAVAVVCQAWIVGLR